MIGIKIFIVNGLNSIFFVKILIEENLEVIFHNISEKLSLCSGQCVNAKKIEAA